jgi:peptidoglycan hydrolase CwlO-like protein
MKQGKTEKAVFAKLASQKVELSVADGLNTLASAKAKVNTATNDIASAIKEFDKVIGKMKNAESDLGVDLSREISEVSKTEQKARKALKAAESLISDLASI